MKTVGLLALMALLTGLSLNAQTLDSVKYCYDLEIEDIDCKGDTGNVIDVQRFDPALGRLENVRMHLKMDVEHTFKVENTAAGESEVALDIFSDVSSGLPLNVTALMQTKVEIDTIYLDAYDGITDYAGPSGYQIDGLVGSGGPANTNETEKVYSGQDLVDFQFAGSGTYPTKTCEQTSFSVYGGGGNADMNIITNGTVQLCVTYYYVKESDLSLQKTVSANYPAVGDSVDFRITVTNDGPTLATGVEVSDPLPVPLTAVAPIQTGYDPVSGIWTVDSLTTGESKELNIRTVVNTGGATVTNIAQVSASDLPDPDSEPDNNESGEDDQDEVQVTLYQLGQIGDYVWFDDDRQGDQDSGESGVDNVRIWLYDNAGNLLDTRVTDASGAFMFSDLHWGDYVIVLDRTSLPEDYESLISDTVFVDLDPGASYLEADFPVAKAYSKLGDYVWRDLDRDGVQDANEPGIENVRLFLENGTGVIDTVVTDEQGYYLFTNIEDTLVQIVLDTTTIPQGYELTSGTIPGGFLQTPPGTVRLDLDYGFHYFHGSIGDLVWYDLNRNGTVDEGEPGISDMIVYLLNEKGERIAKTVTDQQGKYTFKNIPHGSYTIAVDLNSVPGYFSMTTDDSMAVELKKYQNYVLADFGFWSPAAKYMQGGQRKVLAWYENSLQPSPLVKQDYEHQDVFYGNSYTSTRYEYDILLAWASGIDGFVVEWYGQTDNPSNPSSQRLLALLHTAHEMNERYRESGFRFEIIAVQHENSVGTWEENFQFLADSVLQHPAYWGRGDNSFAPLFVFHNEQTMLEPKKISRLADRLLPDFVYLGWNEGYNLSVFEDFDLLYPWVQPMNREYDTESGLLWGDQYLNFEYNNMNRMPDNADILFSIGAVWPGYNNGSKSQPRFIDAQDTLVYQKTWEKVLAYSNHKNIFEQLPMAWTLIQSWNVFSDKTDIVTTHENRYKFERMTQRYSRLFKGDEERRVSSDLGLLVPSKLRQVRIKAIQHPEISWQLDFAATRAMANYFVQDYQEAVSILDQALGLAPSKVHVLESADTFIELEWDAAAAANAYHIFYSKDSTDFQINSREWPDVQTRYTTKARLKGLEAGNVYYIAVAPADTALDAYTHYGWYRNQFSDADIIAVTLNKNNDDIIPPSPVHHDNHLVFVSGSPTFKKGEQQLDWSNAVDGDYTGWDATVWAQGSDKPSDTAWAIFEFADHARYQFNYVALTTDNGNDDNNYHYLKTKRIEVWVSNTGTDPDDFHKVLNTFFKSDGTERMWAPLQEYVKAKYVMLRLIFPHYHQGGWRQIVEFEVHTQEKQGAVPASENQAFKTVPGSFSCESNFPNPFNPSTTIRYTLAEAADVSLNIYNLNGQLVETLVREYQSAGSYQATWHSDEHPSGVYIYRLNAGSFSAVRRMTLLK
ncbi:MAG: SdrD B-like domain-containing protein [candidate division KSB1 bacterium]|nr:SdrD B-like domain-containing protein [candidate division KSB1 bacterium]